MSWKSTLPAAGKKTPCPVHVKTEHQLHPLYRVFVSCNKSGVGAGCLAGEIDSVSPHNLPLLACRPLCEHEATAPQSTKLVFQGERR